MVTIPNAQVSNQRVQNLARTGTCQVKQVLWFRYEDIEKIPGVIKAIKEEIRASCPKLITDGSRPFRVHWSDFKEDHLEVLVNANFNIKPYGDEYMDNRQAVLLAIARAVQKNVLEFALPNFIVKNLDITGGRSESKSDLGTDKN